MKYVIVAPFGPNKDAIYYSIREFPTERIFLITPKEMVDDAENFKRDMSKFKIPVDIFQIDGDLWEETFRAVGEIKASYKDRDDKSVIVNIGMGGRTAMCAATSAAFVNGLKAVDVSKNGVMFLPVLKFSYYKILTDKKLHILTTIYKEKDCCASLDDLSKKTKMSLPLIAYHINGNRKSEGLKEMGLVQTINHGSRISVALTEAGRLLIKGYIM